jgi:hypothetical protein
MSGRAGGSKRSGVDGEISKQAKKVKGAEVSASRAIAAARSHRRGS